MFFQGSYLILLFLSAFLFQNFVHVESQYSSADLIGSPSLRAVNSEQISERGKKNRKKPTQQPTKKPNNKKNRKPTTMPSRIPTLNPSNIISNDLKIFPFNFTSGELQNTNFAKQNVKSLFIHACDGNSIKFDVFATNSLWFLNLYNVKYGEISAAAHAPNIFEALNNKVNTFSMIYDVKSPDLARCNLYRLDLGCMGMTTCNYQLSASIVKKMTNECTACPNGLGTTAYSNINNNTCAQCPKGSYLHASGGCELCPNGYYQDVSGSLTCKICPDKTCSNGDGATQCVSCSPCPYGSIPSPQPPKSAVRLSEKHIFGGRGGRIEFLRNDIWGSVDNDFWDMADAQVVCQQLGMGDAVSIHENYHNFPPSYSTQWVGFDCIGNEKSLLDCQSAENDPMWLIMDVGSPSQPNQDDAKVECSHNSTINNDENIDLQCTRCSERFYYDSVTSNCLTCPLGTYVHESNNNIGIESCTPCPKGTFLDSIGICVVCPMAYYKDLTDSLSCKLCPEGNFTASEITPIAENHDELSDCSFSCDVGSYFNGKICEVCPNGYYKSNKKDITCSMCPKGMLTEGNTTEDHDSYDDCHPCSAGLEAKYGLTYGMYRLVSDKNGESNSFEGRVEVYRDNSWGSVDNDYWDMTDAQILCQNLGMGDAISISVGAYGPSFGIQYAGYDCSGVEENLEDCLDPWNRRQIKSLSYTDLGVMDYGNPGNPNFDDAGVKCSYPTKKILQPLTCQTCAPGYYHDSSVASSCVACPVGKYTSPDCLSPTCYDSVDDCVYTCEDGSYVDGGKCSYCPAGSTKSHYGRILT